MFGPAHPEPEVFSDYFMGQDFRFSLYYNTAFEHENPHIFYFHLHDILL